MEGGRHTTVDDMGGHCEVRAFVDGNSFVLLRCSMRRLGCGSVSVSVRIEFALVRGWRPSMCGLCGRATIRAGRPSGTTRRDVLLNSNTLYIIILKPQ